MSELTKSASWWVAAVVAAGILAAGAKEAFALGSTATCPNDGWNTMGWQPSEFPACWNACIAVHPDLAQVQYTPLGCCKCLF